MTGTGTQTDPYILESYDDLVNSPQDATAYIKLGCDIDFSQEDYDITNHLGISINCCEFDGNNHRLANYFARTTIYAKTVFINLKKSGIIFKNLKIENVYLAGYQLNLFGGNSISYTFSINDSSISCVLADTQLSDSQTPAFLGEGTFTNCEISVEASQKYAKPMTNGSLNGCMVKYDLTTDNCSTSTSSYLLAKNVYYTGLFFNMHSLNSIKISPLIYQNLQYSYIILNCSDILSFENVTTIKAVINSGYLSGVNFIDKDVLGEELTEKLVTDNHLYALTTEQCKDADYLTSIGFECGNE